MNKILVAALLLAAEAALGQGPPEMPMLGSPFPRGKYELVNAIPAEKIARLPKDLRVYKWSREPREFSLALLQTLLKESAFAGTSVSNIFRAGTNKNGAINLISPDNQDYFIVTPAAGRIAFQTINRDKGYPPPDAVPDFPDAWKRALHFAEMLGITTNEMERNLDGSIHIRKTENTSSHLGGSIKYKTKRSVTVFRSIDGYLIRSLDEDKMEVELGVDGRLLRFNFKWPKIEVVSTNSVDGFPQLLQKIKRGEVLADDGNEYPAGGISKVELKDYQIFYYVSNMFPYTRRMVATSGPDIVPMIEFLATFTSSKGGKADGGLFVPIIQVK